MMMMRGTLFFIACTTATFAFVPRLKLAAKVKARLLARDNGDVPAVEVPKAKAVEAEAPKVAPSPAEDPFDQPKAEAKAAPAPAADAPPKKAPAKPVAAEADAKPDAVAKPPATPAAKVDEATADAAAADKPKPVPKKAPPKEYSKPAWAKVGDETSDKKTLKQATSILNKLTLEKFERLSAEFCALPFDSVALVKGAIDLIVDKA